jgi:nucleoside-diphosphate-sugar epimerase
LKKVIVTGHSGYIGSLLSRMLEEKGYDVTGIDTRYFGRECEYSRPSPPHAEIIKDIRRVDIPDLKGAYAVCHLAALSNDPMGEMNRRLTMDINHTASVRLAALAKNAGVEKFIFSSSCSMYGAAESGQALDENAAFRPVTAYAESKMHSERDILPLADGSFCVTFLRNATAYGMSPKFRTDLVVNNLLGWAVTSKQIRVMSDGTPWRPLIHAEDIARAFIAVIEAPSERLNGQAFNTGRNSENYQIRTIADMIGDQVPGCKIECTGEHGSDSRSYRVDFSKIEKQLPEFRPVWTLKEGIRQIHESYRESGLDDRTFNGRRFIRLKQLKYLRESGNLDEHLFWIPGNKS